MSETQSNQENSTVGGHQAGRDVNIYNSPAQMTAMRRWLEKYCEEARLNCRYQQVIDSLQHYITNVDDGQVIGLEGKLSAAGRQDQLMKAMRFKELFAKMLQAHILFKSAQEILAHLLGKMDALFDHKVQPLIAAQRPASDIDAIVLCEVLQPLLNDLDENDLGIHMQQLRGMLYFLTGNCHIKWH